MLRSILTGVLLVASTVMAGAQTDDEYNEATLYQASNVFLAAIINTVGDYFQGLERDEFYDQVFAVTERLMAYPKWQGVSWDAISELLDQVSYDVLSAAPKTTPRPEVAPAMPVDEAAANRRRLTGN